jgi:hypothetical protein
MMVFLYETPILSCKKDIEVSLPGSLGKHALYSILENFIRNSAKHGGDTKYSNLDIVLLLSNLENENHITVTLTDNCSKVSDEKIEEFNRSIQTEILVKKDLGLIDMKVNACLLAGKELTDVNCKESLKAIKTKEGILAYKFKIAKPKKAVFIGEFCKGEQHKDGFFYFENQDEFRKSTISKSFQFAILSDSIFDMPFDDTKQTFLSELPARVIKRSELPETIVLENLLEQLYNVWLTKIRGDDNKKAEISLYFEQKKDIFPTSAFKGKYDITENENKSSLKIYSDEDLTQHPNIDNQKNIFFDRHGGIIKYFHKDLVTPDNSWILIDKNNPDFDYISRYDIDNNKTLLPLELEEAGLLKILIVDERVAEQSVRQLSEDKVSHYINKSKYGFTKFDISNSKLTLFDSAWAANVFLATHLNDFPLKMDIDLETRHMLNVNFNKNGISFQTNITSLYGKFVNDDENKSWSFDEEITSPKCVEIEIKPDVLIIHRTKWKELLNEALLNNDIHFVSRILSFIPNLIVTTGSGTTHGIDGDYKILPYSTLNELILGKRIQKLKFSKLLLQLTKNKI